MEENKNIKPENEFAEATASQNTTESDAVADVNDQDKVVSANATKFAEQARTVSSIFDVVEMIAVCATCILLIFSFCFRLTVVDGPSMNNTLQNGDYLIVQSIAYKPERGDIVVIQDPTATGYTKPLVKRIIAMGGDTVDIDFSTWTVTVNGEVIDESEYLYLAKDTTLTSNYDFPITIEEGNIFVMGDNRNHSADSRVTNIGQIDERCIVGGAIMRILPVSQFRFFD